MRDFEEEDALFRDGSTVNDVDLMANRSVGQSRLSKQVGFSFVMLNAVGGLLCWNSRLKRSLMTEL